MNHVILVTVLKYSSYFHKMLLNESIVVYFINALVQTELQYFNIAYYSFM